MWKLNHMIVNNQLVKEHTSITRKGIKLNENENT